MTSRGWQPALLPCFGTAVCTTIGEEPRNIMGVAPCCDWLVVTLTGPDVIFLLVDESSRHARPQHHHQVSSGAPSARRYGASMYRGIFWEFSDPFNRQEVVGALITHCGAGSEIETDSALSALSALASPRWEVELLVTLESNDSCYRYCCMSMVFEVVNKPNKFLEEISGSYLQLCYF